MTEAIDLTGEDIERVQNWHLAADNGTVNGLEVTPAKTSEISIALGIVIFITRQTGSLSPARPRTTQVALGTFPVASDTCVISTTMSSPGRDRMVVLTFFFDGEYTEVASDGSNAIYWSANNIAFYQGHWIDLPPQAKAILLSQLMADLDLPDVLARGED